MRLGRIVRPRDPNPSIPPALRRRCTRKRCEACHVVYGEITKQNGRYLLPRECLDHIFARRWLRQWKQDPHKSVNLVSVCGSCHGGKKVAEDHLFAGDVLTFIKFILQKHWPIQKVIRAARHYGFPGLAQRIANHARSFYGPDTPSA